MQGSSLTSKSTVILFKTPSDPVSSDQYLQTLSPAYQPHFIPVLEEKYHLDSLLTILQQEKEWEGVVITSRRGAEGWIKAVKAFKENHQSKSGYFRLGVELPILNDIELREMDAVGLMY